MSDNIKIIQSQEYKLAGAGASSTDTSIRIRNFNQIDGTILDMTNFGIKGFGTLEPNTSREEAIVWTGIVDNGDGTSTLTGVSRVLTVYPYTETSGIANLHAGSTVFVVSDNPGLFNTFANKLNDETVEETWTFTDPNYPRIDDATAGPTADEQFTPKKYVNDEDLLLLPLDATRSMTGELDFGTNKAINLVDPTADQDAATKKYVDDTAIAGSPDASETVKGNAEKATDIEAAAGTDVGGTGAFLFTVPSQVKDSVTTNTKQLVGTGAVSNTDWTNYQLLFSENANNMWSFSNVSSNRLNQTFVQILQDGGSITMRNSAEDANGGFINVATGNPTVFGEKDVYVQGYVGIMNSPDDTSGWGLNSFGLGAPRIDITINEGLIIGSDGSNDWYAQSCDGAAITKVLIASLTPTTIEGHSFRIEYEVGVEARYYVDGVLEATITTNLPTTGNIAWGCRNGGLLSGSGFSTVTPPTLSIAI